MKLRKSTEKISRGSEKTIRDPTKKVPDSTFFVAWILILLNLFFFFLVFSFQLITIRIELNHFGCGTIA